MRFLNLKALIVLSTVGLMAQAPAPQKSEEGTGPEKSVIAAPEGGAPVDPHTYKVGPEDVVGVKVWREPELSGQFVVRPDGRVTLPLHGEMNVENLTLEQIKESVTKAYSQYVNKPEVTVGLLRVGSKKYYLVGEVTRTGVFPLVVPTTILEAINAAGGLREFANKKKIVVLRGAQRIKFNYSDVIKGKNLEQNILLESGDQIFVP